MGKPECFLVTRHPNTQARFTLTRKTQKFECLCERRGAWASPKRSVVKRHTNTQEQVTITHKMSR